MPKLRGMWIACIVGLIASFFLQAGAVRADSIFTMPAPNGGEKQLIEWSPKITYVRSTLSSGSVESFGTLTITAYPITSPKASSAMLIDGNIFAPDDTGSVMLIPSSFKITVDINVKVVGSGYEVSVLGNTLMNLKGTATPVSGSPVPLTFNTSTDLSAFAINLNGTTVNPLAVMFTRDVSDYYTGGDEGYVIAQLKKIKTSSPGNPNGDPLVGQNFFIGSGVSNAKTWEASEYKLDVFAVALPLPAPFYMGLFGLVGVAGVTTFMKKRRCA